MRSAAIHKLLDLPIVYNLVQSVFAPGAKRLVVSQIQRITAQVPQTENVLDIGCGPQSWLWQIGLSPLGLDLSYSYSKAYSDTAQPVVNASSDDLPFPDERFGGVWSIGMFHHLPDPVAKKGIQEMIRVCQGTGYVAIIDAVLPVKRWRAPLAYAIRSADRGEYMRSQAGFEALLPAKDCWSVTRARYSYNGLEILVSWVMKSSLDESLKTFTLR